MGSKVDSVTLSCEGSKHRLRPGIKQRGRLLSAAGISLFQTIQLEQFDALGENLRSWQRTGDMQYSLQGSMVSCVAPLDACSDLLAKLIAKKACEHMHGS